MTNQQDLRDQNGDAICDRCEIALEVPLADAMPCSTRTRCAVCAAPLLRSAEGPYERPTMEAMRGTQFELLLAAAYADEAARQQARQQYGPAVLLSAYDEDEARDDAGSELFELTEPNPSSLPTVPNLRRVADLAHEAQGRAWDEHFNVPGQTQPWIAYQTYANGVEDVVRWLAGDAAPTPELAAILNR